MRIVGVIAEYNPFHSGHAHQLRQAREAAHADAVVAVMSGCFVQRGDAAIVSPAIRAKMALLNGADAVILLPALWSVRDAEHFALGGVHLLTGLGCDALSFGAETADLPMLQAAVDALESPDLPAAIQPHLSAGLPYPAALSAAMAEVAPAAARVLQSPNNTLGVCYLRALRRLGACTRLPARRIITRLPLGMAFRPPRRFAPPSCAATGHPPIPPCRGVRRTCWKIRRWKITCTVRRRWTRCCWRGFG